MQEKIIFREMLSELKAYADTKNNMLSQEEIKEFLKMHISPMRSTDLFMSILEARK